MAAVSGKVVAGIVITLLAGGLGALVLQSLVVSAPSTLISEKPSPPEVSPGQLSKAAFDACDVKAADPEDANRQSAPVPTERFAPGDAILACRESVRLNPGNPTAIFELGRSLWVARQDQEAFTYLKQGADLGYPIAEKYVGDAIYQQRLPQGMAASADQAAQWYDKADKAGVASAHDALLLAEKEMRRHNFDLERDGSQFQQPDYIQVLWSGELSAVKSPVGLAYYVQGLIGELDGNDSIFMDMSCKPAITSLGRYVLDYAQAIALVKLVLDSQNLTQDDYNARVMRAIADWWGGDHWSAAGAKDAQVLFNKEVYGCDSPVARQIINNIVLRLKIGDANTIQVMNTPAQQ